MSGNVINQADSTITDDQIRDLVASDFALMPDGTVRFDPALMGNEEYAKAFDEFVKSQQYNNQG